MGALNVLQAIVHGFTSRGMLIIAIGGQKPFLLRPGRRRGRGGGGARAAPPMRAWGARWLGAAFLLLYALKTAVRVCRQQAMPSGAADAGSAAGARARVLLTAL